MSQLAIFMVCSAVLLGISSAQDFEFLPTRAVGRPNVFNFACITDLNGDNDRNVIFLLNGTDVRELGGNPVVTLDGTFSFTLTRELEGVYSCASTTRVGVSNEVALIVLPTDFNQGPVNPTSFFAEAGQTATLQCSIPPGNLVQQYFVTWQNEEGTIFGQVDTSFQFSTRSSRYSINPETFALQISNVQVSDSGLAYRCILGVRDENQRQRRYEATVSRNISLTVYKPPVVLWSPVDQTIPQSERQTQFTCTVVSEPKARITWLHNGVETTDTRTYHTSQNSAVEDSEGRGLVVTGTLNILGLRPSFSGSVECVASIELDERIAGRETVPQAISKARLSVLSRFKSTDVFITDEGDVIFRLNLRGVLNTPINLLFEYTDASGDEDELEEGGVVAIKNRTTTAAYNSTDNITHIEFESQVPFEKFYVRVALIDVVDKVLGPFSESMGKFDLSKPTLVTSSSLTLKVAAASLVPIAFFLLLFLTIIVLCCACMKNKHKNIEIEHEKDKLEQLRDIIDSLKGEVPKEHFLEFLRFSEQLLVSYCSTCPSFRVGRTVGVVMQRGEVHLNLGDEEEKDSVDFHEDLGGVEGEGEEGRRGGDEIHMPKQVLKAVTNTVRAGLSHPNLGRSLHRQLSAMLTDATTPTTAAKGGAQDQNALIPNDGGYNSRSTSDSSAPDN